MFQTHWIDEVDSWIPLLNVRNDPEVNGLLQDLQNKSERQVLETLKNFLVEFIVRHINPIPEKVMEHAQSQATPEILESLLQYLKCQPLLLYEYEEHLAFLFALVKAVSFK